MKNFHNSMRKQKRKPIVCYFVKDEKLLKLDKKNEKENLICNKAKIKFMATKSIAI